MAIIHVVDLYHGDDPVDFHAMLDAGAVGVILKAVQGANEIDPLFESYYKRASTVFEAGCVHSYAFLTGDIAVAQIRNYLSVTDGMPGRWLDYERNPNQCSLDTAVTACHILADKQGSYPGMYGSDEDLLGDAIDAGHFAGACPIWLARYRSTPPDHACDLWQFSDGVTNQQLIGGKAFDLSQFQRGDANACKAWMKKFAGIPASVFPAGTSAGDIAS